MPTFVDDGRTLHDFTGTILVVCPRCAGAAVVVPMPYADDEAASVPDWLEPRRLVCPACGLTRDRNERHASYGEPVDPYFQLPLLLQAASCGHTVWAYNAEHVDHLLRFIAATLRSRVPQAGRPQSLIERLPTWFGLAKNRAAITKSLRQLAATSARHDRASDHGTG